jgi:hypothetical protein
MSLRAIPLIAVAFILYNILAVLGVDFGHCVSDKPCSASLFSLPMPSKKNWVFTWGDLLIIITLAMLFVELLKSTYTSTSSLVDHGLSLIVMIVCLVEFILVPSAATSVFFIILFATLIDVIAGYTIGIRVAKRDVSFGGSDN